jgi:hypothetical protein
MRPSTVTRAVWLLRIVGLTYLATAFVLLIGAGGVPGAVRAGIADAGVDPRAYPVVEGFAVAMPIVAALVTAVIGFGFLLVGRLARSGRSGVHVAAVVLTLLAAIGGLLMYGLAGSPILGAFFYVSAWSNLPDSGPHTYSSRLTDLYDPGLRTANLVLGLIAMIAAAVGFGLLMTRSSREWFQGPPAAAAPPMWVPPQTAAPSAPAPDLAAALSVLQRKHERGELSDAEYAQTRELLLRDGAAG